MKDETEEYTDRINLAINEYVQSVLDETETYNDALVHLHEQRFYSNDESHNLLIEAAIKYVNALALVNTIKK